MQNYNSNEPLKFSDRLPLPPSLTSYDAGWRSLSLEQHSQPPGEIPRFCLDRYTIAIHTTHKSVHYLGGLSPTQLKLVTNYINDRLEQELSLDELAAIAQLSTYHFCRSFKRSTGFTPHQYVIRQRVERAKLLLRERKIGIAQVAISCGFTHQSHLNRHFKRSTGMTPKKFSKS